MPVNLQLNLGDEADPAVRRAIAAPLNAFNDAKAGIDPWRPLVITITNEAGAIVGGLWGSTGYTWL